MFEAISSKTTQTRAQEIQAQEAVSSKVGISQPVKPVKSKDTGNHDQFKTSEIQQAIKEKTTEESPVSDALLKGLEEDFEMIHNVGLQFSVHEGTGRTMVKVFNKEDGALIREIPSEELLNLAAKLDEMMGIIFDETV